MNGVILLDKPQGKTSHDMVYFIRRVTGVKKVGHTGTLDPMATGVLPICIGAATKAADMLTFSDKRYIAELTFGAETDTLDAEGSITAQSDKRCTEEEFHAAAARFTGEIEQIPPMYSAIKQNGKKLYELARQGAEVERKPRAVTIHSIDILEFNGETAKIDVSCSKGTYIRTLCADMGKYLGTLAYMSALRRTRTGQFDISRCYAPDEITRFADEGRLGELIIPIDELFSDYPKLILTQNQEKSVRNGVRMTYRGGKEGQTYRVFAPNGEFLCISEIRDGRLCLVKSFWG